MNEIGKRERERERVWTDAAPIRTYDSYDEHCALPLFRAQPAATTTRLGIIPTAC